jgi:hypothetical protein
MTERHDLNDWDRQIIEEFRANGGAVDHRVTMARLNATGGALAKRPWGSHMENDHACCRARTLVVERNAVARGEPTQRRHDVAT